MPLPPTPYTWQPTYPDRLPSAAERIGAAVLAGSLFFCPLPIGQASIAVSAAPSQLRAGRQIQYQARAQPFTAALAPPPTVTPESWLPSYPDQVWPLRTLLLAAQPTYTGPPYIPQLQWFPLYPDRIWPLAALPIPEQTTYTGPPFVPQKQWQAFYPDRIWPPATLTTAVQATYAGTLPPYVPRQQWTPIFVDQIWPTQGLRAELQRTLALDPFPRPSIVTVALDWLVQQPDPLRAAPPLQPPVPPPTYLPLSDLRWLPTYPDRIDRATVRAADQQASFTPTYLPLTDLRWLPNYPDRIWPTQSLPAYLQQVLAFDPLPRLTIVPVLAWLPIYPDFARGLVYLPALQLPWTSITSILIWTGPINPCPPASGTGGDSSVTIGRGW